MEEGHMYWFDSNPLRFLGTSRYRLILYIDRYNIFNIRYRYRLMSLRDRDTGEDRDRSMISFVLEKWHFF